MLPYLNLNSVFPPVSSALDDPNGLLAAGGDLSPERLLKAYSNGIFPWYSHGEPILWWSPDPRTIFDLAKFKVHKSVKQTLRQNSLEVTLNYAFEQVVEQCSLQRGKKNATWITEEIKQAYLNLFKLGNAHSIEVWRDKQLVGGIYGVQVGGIFCGESMFSRIPNGSKIALSCLAKYLAKNGFKAIDCQVENPHLMLLGAKQISRDNYLSLLQQNENIKIDVELWKQKPLNWYGLLGFNINV